MKPSIVALIASIGLNVFSILSLVAIRDGEYFQIAVYSFLFGACFMAVMSAIVIEYLNNKQNGNEKGDAD